MSRASSPSSTIEDYAKSIHKLEASAEGRGVATGHIARDLGVTPGTVTTMVKGMARSGLVDYAPYAGVRLTTSGRRLATDVVRRHRVVELFLVEFMGMDWGEVHKDAEVLEHAVSERLIDRMDEMLGRPAVDPHGDPIPSRRGKIVESSDPSLLTCPLRQRVRITRVLDQTPTFLQQLESMGLLLDRRLVVRSRSESWRDDESAGPGAVTVRTRSHGDTALDPVSAGKILVRSIG